MTLTELVNEVYIITNRPDRVNETLSAVRSATLKVHRSDYYFKDLFETGITFPSLAYTQAIDYRTIVPRWRSLKYLRKYDLSSYLPEGVAGKFFDLITPESSASLDSYSINREDVVYMAGEVIQVRSKEEIQYALMGCYINPLIGSTDETFSSWIAIEYPWAIIHMAASMVFRAIGKLDESQAQLQMYSLELNELAMSNIVAVGM